MTATQALALLLLIVGSCAIAALARRRGVAAPILLAWRLRRENALDRFDPWTVIAGAAHYLSSTRWK